MAVNWTLCLSILVQCRIIFVASFFPPMPNSKFKHCNPTSNSSNAISIKPTVTGVKSRREMFLVSLKGYRLKDCSYLEKHVGSILECAHLCLRENGQCRSTNFEKGQNDDGEKSYMCNLNNSTRENHVHKFVTSSTWDYVEPIKIVNGVLLPMYDDNKEIYKSCAELYKQGVRDDGIYEVDPEGKGKFSVRCDMRSSGGGWTVFQRRFDGSVDFYRNWPDYKNGFGHMTGEFWLGLENTHRLINNVRTVLRIEMEDFEGEKRYAEYATFQVLNECEQYKLLIGNYTGNAGDSLGIHNNMKFATKDVHNDYGYFINCAALSRGGWWYRLCHKANLNGHYYSRGQNVTFQNGISWVDWTRYSLKATEMKIRPLYF